MKPKFLYLLAITICIYGCKQSASKKSVAQKTVIAKTANTKTPKQSNDTLQINTKCAVAITLDIDQLDKLRKKQGDDTYYTAADDGVFYSYVADSVLKAKHLPIIRNKKQKYLRFAQLNGQSRLIKLDTLSQVFNYYFFDPAKTPHQIDLVEVDAEYKDYFEK